MHLTELRIGSLGRFLLKYCSHPRISPVRILQAFCSPRTSYQSRTLTRLTEAMPSKSDTKPTPSSTHPKVVVDITRDGRVTVNGVVEIFRRDAGGDDDDDSSSHASTTAQVAPRPPKAPTWWCQATQKCRSQRLEIPVQQVCPSCHSEYGRPPRVSVRELVNSKGKK